MTVLDLMVELAKSGALPGRLGLTDNHYSRSLSQPREDDVELVLVSIMAFWMVLSGLLTIGTLLVSRESLRQAKRCKTCGLREKGPVEL